MFEVYDNGRCFCEQEQLPAHVLLEWCTVVKQPDVSRHVIISLQIELVNCLAPTAVFVPKDSYFLTAHVPQPAQQDV
jgi:hypothetical protein